MIGGAFDSKMKEYSNKRGNNFSNNNYNRNSYQQSNQNQLQQVASKTPAPYGWNI
jgi:hypothetical protein